MRNIYRVTYRSSNGRIKAQDLPADSLFDSAIAVCQSHHLKTLDIISNVIQSEGVRKSKKRVMPEGKRGKRASTND